VAPLNDGLPEIVCLRIFPLPPFLPLRQASFFFALVDPPQRALDIGSFTPLLPETIVALSIFPCAFFHTEVFPFFSPRLSFAWRRLKLSFCAIWAPFSMSFLDFPFVVPFLSLQFSFCFFLPRILRMFDEDIHLRPQEPSSLPTSVFFFNRLDVFASLCGS